MQIRLVHAGICVAYAHRTDPNPSVRIDAAHIRNHAPQDIRKRSGAKETFSPTKQIEILQIQ